MVAAIDPSSLGSALDRLTSPGAPESDDGRRLMRRAAQGAGRALVTVAVVVAVWVAFLKLFHVSTFIGKGPLDVWRYVTSAEGAAANRADLLRASGVTLRDAGLGLAGGTVAALVVAAGFTLSRAVSAAFLPLAMVLRSVPLVAMTPLIVGVFGRNLGAITVIGGVVTFFPTLVNVSLALRRAPIESIELCRAYGASPATTLWKVQVPAALPALFASLRIAAPLALVGALLAEWLATGKGLGYELLNDGPASDFAGMWTRVVLVTAYSAALYQVIGALERRVLRRFGAVGE